MPKASVKIMRSYDYCHFEVCLGSDEDLTLQQVDSLRKDAARLVDKAIVQYQNKKTFETWRANNEWDHKQLITQVNEISKIPEGERTPEQKAIVKALDDLEFALSRGYDYEDEE